MPRLTRTTTKSKQAKKVWLDDESHALTLLTLFIDAYAVEGVSWDPETILLEIKDDFGVELSADNFDKLLAAITVLTTDDFFWSLPDFINICNIFSGDTHIPEVFDPAGADEMAWGITQAMLISPPEKDEPFEGEIRGYIGEVLRVEGIVNAPDVLRIALGGESRQMPAEFSDDPLMYEMIYKMEQDKTNAINTYVKQNLHELVEQITQLPLVNGDTKDIAKKLKRSLSK
jgi:hypothetical protein